MVVTLRPATVESGVMQERMALPSKWTVQAPHSAIPQPNLVPVRPANSRTAHNRGMLGSASNVVGLPLSTNEVDMVAPISCYKKERLAAPGANVKGASARRPAEKPAHGASLYVRMGNERLLESLA